MLFTLQTTVVITMFKWTLYHYFIYFGDDSVKLQQQLKGQGYLIDILTAVNCIEAANYC